MSDSMTQWLERQAKKTGESQGKIVRDQLTRARRGAAAQSFMRLAGAVRGDKQLSTRKGFTRT